MIVRRYGDQVEAVRPNFKSHALSEIGFQREEDWSLSTDEFERRYRKVEEREFSPEAEGWVQSEVEAEVLKRLESELSELESNLADEEVLLVENRSGVDYPKLREHRKTVVVEGRNRYHFRRWVEPPLSVGVYRREG